jgi:Co/Zn/Cd efflux system component
MATIIITAVMVAQYFVLSISGSRTVRNDLIHSLFDVFSYVAGAVAILFLLRSNFGEVIRERCALISAILFIGAGLFVLYDFTSEAPVQHRALNQMLLVGVVGIIGNALAHFTISQTPEEHHGHDHELFKWHNLFDMFFSLLVILAVACTNLGMPRIDLWLGAFGGIIMLAYGAYMFSRIVGGRPHTS